MISYFSCSRQSSAAQDAGLECRTFDNVILKPIWLIWNRQAKFEFVLLAGTVVPPAREGLTQPSRRHGF